MTTYYHCNNTLVHAGSPFDRTAPLKESSWRLERPGGHGPPKAISRPAAAMPDEPRYMSATGEYYHPRTLPGPRNFQKARNPCHPDAPGGAFNSLARPIIASKAVSCPKAGAVSASHFSYSRTCTVPGDGTSGCSRVPSRMMI